MIHTATSVKSRMAAFEKLRQEVLGAAPAGRFSAFSDLEFQSSPEDGEAPVCAALRAAIVRDAKHCTAGPVFLRQLGMSQALRAVYDGGKKLVEGGAR